MANRPTGPEQGDDVPDPTQPLDPAPTAAQPPAEPVPPVAPPAPEQPAWTAASGPAQPGPHVGPPSPRPPGRARRAWDEATSTTGGRVAVGAAAVLAAFLVVAVIAVGALGVHALGRGGELAGREAGHGREDGRHAANDGPMGGQGRDGQQDRRRGPDGQQDRGQGGRRDQGRVPGQGRGGSGQPGRPGLPGQGLRQGPGAMMGAMNGLDDVLHGEFTTTATGDPVVMVVQVGQVTAYTQARSITVKSSDGFEGTYDLTGPYASSRIGLPLEVGAQVRVVAAKDGLKATRLNVLR